MSTRDKTSNTISLVASWVLLGPDVGRLGVPTVIQLHPVHVQGPLQSVLVAADDFCSKVDRTDLQKTFGLFCLSEVYCAGLKVSTIYIYIKKKCSKKYSQR